MVVYSGDVICLMLSCVIFEGIVLDRYAMRDMIFPLGNHGHKTGVSHSGPLKQAHTQDIGWLEIRL